MHSTHTTRPPRRWAGLVARSAVVSMLAAGAISLVGAPSAVAASAVTSSAAKVSDTTPRVGQKLTAKTGSWAPAPVGLTYQWYRGSVAIQDATGSTYQVQAVDLGNRLRVKITGSHDGLSAKSRTSSSTSKVARGYLSAKPKPVITSAASPVVDQTLTAVAGTWAPAKVKLAYQWYKVSSKNKTYKLKGATLATYTVAAADKGYKLKVKVSGSKDGFYSASATSSKTAKVVQYTFSAKPKPVISGTPAPKSTLAVNPGAWSPSADTLSIQWKRAGKAIDGETGRTHAVVNADLGLPVTVTVTAMKPGYAPVSVTSAAVTPRGPDSDLHVGSFNLSGSNTDAGASGEHQAWSKRMPVAVSQILGEKLDVLGLQEAYWGGTTTQYNQLRDALNRAGGTYAVVDADKASSAGDRIIYNTSTLRVLDHGVYKYSAQASGKQTRYLVWATLQSLSTGKSFFFADTHLDPYSAKDTYESTVKVREWRELVAIIPKLNDADLPVVTVGDFNTSKWWKEVKEMLPAMKAAGFGDVMNQQYQTNPPSGVRAEVVEDGWINSFNGYRRDVSKYSYPTNHAKVGNGVDWIFATNSLRVKKWRVVADFNPSTLQIIGVIPSDHCMLSAVVVL